MSEKDFLSQFSGKNTVPESFREEERKPVYKPKKPVNKILVIILCALLLVVGIAVYFIFFAPNIEMPDFSGKTKNDVAAWVKQQGIETSGIIFQDDYYFDYDEGVVISQSVEAGKKVKENVKITFVSSLGADPDELIKTPDLMSMTKSEIQEWIKDNKLTKTKVTTAYSEDIEEGNVISFNYSGCEEDTFTRSSTLKISVSKGPAPAGTIAVEDFTKKTYDAVKTWADSKKVTLTKTEQYSDTVDKGYVISQSIASGKTLKEDETLNVVVSKGKAVTIIDFTDMSSDEITRWCTKNGVVAYITKKYSDETSDYFVSCSPKANAVIGTGDSIDVVISLGDPNAPSTFTTENELKTWVEEANKQGAYLTLVNDGSKFDDTAAAGTLIYYETENDVGDHLHYSVSRGKNLWIIDASSPTTWANLNVSGKLTEKQARALLTGNNIENFVIEYETSTTVEANMVIRAKRSDGVTLAANSYLPEDVTVTVTVCSEKVSE